MSFGFSIGDFITLLDKAHLVYRKCKSAPSDYAVLAQHVEILTHVLEETRSILSPSLASSLPKPKLNSLVSARESCQITLDEVEKFLNKYEDMGKKHPTYFKRVKFIGKDVEGLKARLSLSTNLLQLGLSSLSSQSISLIQNALDANVKEYQVGARAPSVVSDAIDGQPVNKDELIHQVFRDLEDKGIHPNSILVNKPFINSWVSQVCAEHAMIGQSEARRAPQIAGEVHKIRKKKSFEFKSAPDEEDTTNFENPFIKPTPLAEPTRVIEPTGPRVVLSSLKNFDSIYSLLSPLTKYHPGVPSNHATTLERISQAFWEQDWNFRGFLTRKEVYEVCKRIVQRMRKEGEISGHGIDILLQELKTTVGSFGANRDGEIGLKEYTALMKSFIQEIVKENHFRMAMLIKKYMAKGKKQITRDSLPWCWKDSSSVPRPSIRYLSGDLVAREQWMASESATMLAREAEIVASDISDFKQDFLAIAPASFQPDLSSTLTLARKAALAFSIFEHPKHPLFVSDLDIGITSGRLLLTSKRVAWELDSIVINVLEIPLFIAFRTLWTIQGFAKHLGYIRRTMKDTNGQLLPSNLPLKWELNYMDLRARAITEAALDWSEGVVSMIGNARKLIQTVDLQHSALELVSSYLLKAKEEARPKLRTECIEVKFSSFSLSEELSADLSGYCVMFKIAVDSPSQMWQSTTYTMPLPALEKFPFGPLLELSITSRVTVDLIYGSRESVRREKANFCLRRRVFDSELLDNLLWEMKDANPLDFLQSSEGFLLVPIEKQGDFHMRVYFDKEECQSLQEKVDSYAVYWTNLLK